VIHRQFNPEMEDMAMRMRQKFNSSVMNRFWPVMQPFMLKGDKDGFADVHFNLLLGLTEDLLI